MTHTDVVKPGPPRLRQREEGVDWRIARGTHQHREQQEAQGAHGPGARYPGALCDGEFSSAKIASFVCQTVNGACREAH